MKKLRYKVLGLFLVFSMVGFQIVATANIDETTKKDDTQAKVFLNSPFSCNLALLDENEVRVSSWDVNEAAGKVEPGPGLFLRDDSNTLPMTANRTIENITYGEAVVEMSITLENEMKGVNLSLRDNELPIFSYEFDNENMYLQQKGEDLLALKYKPKANYFVKTVVNFDKKSISVFIDGKKVIDNADFSSNATLANNFNITTGKESTGKLGVHSIRIYRGYFVNEAFTMSTSIPQDWEMFENNGEVKKSQADVYAGNAFDKGSATLNSEQKDSVLVKNFQKQSENSIFEFQLLYPKKRDGVEVGLYSGNDKVFNITSDKKNFTYEDANKKIVPFYDYIINVWYHFKIDINFDTHRADLYLNGKLKEKDIKIPDNITSFDNVKAKVLTKDKGEVSLDNILLYPKEVIEDYVPEPKKVGTDDYDIGMQMCSLWTEGNHFGYDYLNDAPSRKPLLGFYDEGNAEVADWEIKWMVEHGIDFQWYCWYKPGTPSTPLQDGYLSPAIHEGFFNAKYSDQMKFAIMWENAGINFWTDDPLYNKECFLNYVAPFWIEYYFKDDRYYKPNGRPLVGAYYIWYIESRFGSYFPSMLEEFKDMCVKAGVGEPLFVMQLGVESEALNFYEKMEGWGVDSTYSYSFGATWPEREIEYNKLAIDRINENKIDLQYIPIINPGVDDYPWGRTTGTLWNQELLTDALTKLKDECLPLIDTSKTDRKIMLLGSWNEFNEGHYYMPTEGTQFQFLDAVKDVFVGKYDHEDIAPTEHQKDRFDNLYPKDRVTPIREEIVSTQIPATSKLKSGWYFDKDSEGWTKGSGTRSMEVKDGKLKITADSDVFGVLLSNVNIEISNVDYVKIRLKNNSSAFSARMKFTNQFSHNFDLQHRMNYHIERYGDDFVDIVLPVCKYPDLWKGNLEMLDFVFEESKPGDTLEIDSIEFYEKENSKKTILNIDNWKQEIDTYTHDNNIMIPLRQLVTSMEGLIYWDNDTKTISIRRKDKKYCEIKVGENEITLDNKKIQMHNPIVIDNSTAYASMELISKVFDKDVMYKDNQVFVSTQKSLEINRSNEERELFYSAEFNKDGNIEGYDYSLGLKTKTVENGFLNVTYNSGDPIIFSPQLGGYGINAQDVKAISIGVRSSAAIEGQIFFTTSEYPTIVYDQVLNINFPPSNETVECFIKPDHRNFKGTLNQLRLDLGDRVANNMQIDYIRIYGDFTTQITDEELYNRFDSKTVATDSISWDFDINNTKDGWALNKNIANTSINYGWLKMLSIGNNPSLYTVEKLQKDAKDISKIQIRFKNMTDGETARLYFSENDKWDLEHSFEIETIKQDSVGTVYTIDTRENPLWKGTINSLKFNPTDKMGNIEIDYIKLINK